MIDDLDYKEASERQEMTLDDERKEYQSTIRALTELVAILEGEQARADAQAATIEALRARVARADKLAEAARRFRLYSAELSGALAAYRATGGAE